MQKSSGIPVQSNQEKLEIHKEHNKEIQNIPEGLDLENIENIRIGYQVAVSLNISRAQEVWSQFGTIVTANSIVLAAATLALSSNQSNLLLSVGMSIVGLVLCLMWLVLTVRGYGFTEYYILAARELEEKFLLPINTIDKGGKFASGEEIKMIIDGHTVSKRIQFVGRIFPVRTVAYLVILVFVIMYLLLLWSSFS